MPTLQATDVRKSLPLGRERIEILKGISLRVAPGEFAAIMGPSGSGKSTLLGIIAGLDKPTSGRVLVDGVDITTMGEARLAGIRNARIGMVFQAFNLIPTLTAQEMLGLVGLSHRLRNRPNQLSGGEQQRVAIARALATNPAIVIMDEPTGNLDRQNGDNLLRLIRDLRQTTGMTFVIATHDASVAGAADRAIHLVDGLVAQQR